MHRCLTRWAPLAIAACGALLPPAPAAAAEGYPDKPVTLVVPTAAAGGTDTIARVMADALGKRLGQSVVVDNRPGANGILGVEAGARAAPDGIRGCQRARYATPARRMKADGICDRMCT